MQSVQLYLIQFLNEMVAFPIHLKAGMKLHGLVFASC